MSRLGASVACLVGLVALTGSARAHESYGEVRTATGWRPLTALEDALADREVMVPTVCRDYLDALSAEAGDEEGEYGVALDARDDCEDSALVAQPGSLTRLATIQDSALIVCPWGYGDDNTECQ